jgi:hypothetical protein
MRDGNNMLTEENRIKTFRWLFYMSLFQLLVCFILPVILFPIQVLLPIELFAALTVGLLFGLYFLGVNIYGIFIDKRRRTIYGVITSIISLWIIWAVYTWLFIDQMDYLT